MIGKHILAWKSKGLSRESIKTPPTSSSSLFSALNYINAKIQVKINTSCLKEEKLTFNHNTAVNIYIVYEINLWPFNPHMHKMGPQGHKQYIFGNQFYSKNVRMVRLHEFLQFLCQKIHDIIILPEVDWIHKKFWSLF